MKNLCPIHHYYYCGNSCPLCTREKNAKIYESHSKPSSKKSSGGAMKEGEISDKDIKRLKEKFGSK